LTGFVQIDTNQNAPQTTGNTLGSRNQVRDGQSIVLGGLFGDTFTKNVRGIPYLRNVPLFSWLFENPRSTRDTNEAIAVFTPEIIRMRDMDSKRFPRPEMPESEDSYRERGETPILKALPYKPTTVEMRPVAGSDVKAKAVTPVAVQDRPAIRSEMPERANGRATASRSEAPKATVVPVADKKKQASKTAEVAPRPKPLPPVDSTPAESAKAPKVEDRPAGEPSITPEYGPAASNKVRPSSSQASLSNPAPETIP
jgi:hypothetical protein